MEIFMPDDQLTVSQWNYKVSILVDIYILLLFYIWMEENNQAQSLKRNTEQKFE